MVFNSLAMKSKNNFAYEFICFVLLVKFLWSDYLKNSVPVLLKIEPPSSKLCSLLEKSSDTVDKNQPLHCRDIHREPLQTGQPLFIFKDLIGVSLQDAEFKIWYFLSVCTCVHMYT